MVPTLRVCTKPASRNTGNDGTCWTWAAPVQFATGRLWHVGQVAHDVQAYGVAQGVQHTLCVNSSGVGCLKARMGRIITGVAFNTIVRLPSNYRITHLPGLPMSALFEPFKLKDVTLRNRIAIPPMCQYMADDGMVNDWHHVHLAGMARGGAGLLVVEATAVAPEGRITPGCAVWSDAHAEAFVPMVSDQGRRFGAGHSDRPRRPQSQRQPPWEVMTTSRPLIPAVGKPSPRLPSRSVPTCPTYRVP